MPSARRFPPPWVIDEHPESFIVRDATGQALGYFYFEDEPRRAPLSATRMDGPPIRKTLTVWTKVVAVSARGCKAAVVWKKLEVALRARQRRTHLGWRIPVGRSVANAVAVRATVKAEPTRAAHRRDVGRWHVLARS